MGKENAKARGGQISQPPLVGVGVAVGGIRVGDSVGELVGIDVLVGAEGAGSVPVTDRYPRRMRACADVVLSPIKRKFGV